MRASLLAVRNRGGKVCGKGPTSLKKWLKCKMSLSMLLKLEIRTALHYEYSLSLLPYIAVCTQIFEAVEHNMLSTF